MADEELKQYRAQLVEVEEALKKDPGNAELLASRETLQEIISLSEALATEGDGDATAAEAAEGSEVTGEPAAKRQKGDDSYVAGQECEALHPSEKRWYHAMVKVAFDDGSVIVDFGGLEPPVQLQHDELRPVGATGVVMGRIDDESNKAVNPNEKRNRASGDGQRRNGGGDGDKVPTEIPEYLKIKPTDSEKVKQQKQKRIKAIKSKMRFAKKDEESAARRASWQSFAKKSGITKHQSLFSSSSAPRTTSKVTTDREQFSAAAMRKNVGAADPTPFH